MKLITLTQGYSAMVDDADFEWLNQWKWCAMVVRRTVYAVRSARNAAGKLDTIRMHRQILGLTDPTIFGEHEDGNGLNNTRKNLRPCTPAQNTMNRGSEVNSSSRFRGVSINVDGKTWRSGIRIDGRTRYFGTFENEEDAARQFNHLAKIYHGSFARYNEVEPIFPEKIWSKKILIRTNTSGFRGVRFRKKRGKWCAEIRENGKVKHIGSFDDPLNAAKAYDSKAKEIFGENALLNFP